MDLLERWNQGGTGMYPIAIAMLVGIVIIIERAHFLFVTARMNKAALLRGLEQSLEQGGVDAALRFVAGQRPAPLALMVKSGLMNAPHGEVEVQAALDEATLRETPRLEARTGYLAMLGNAAMLAGLLGTVSGLIESFRVVAHVEASAKATILLPRASPAGPRGPSYYVGELVASTAPKVSTGAIAGALAGHATTLRRSSSGSISEAMNCTFFGLVVAIPMLVGFSVLTGRTQVLLDDMSETSVTLLNLLARERARPASSANRAT